MDVFITILYLVGLWLGFFAPTSQGDLFGAMDTIGDTVDKFLGPASTILGIVSFVMDLIPEPNDTGGTIVAIGANDQSNDGQSRGGNIRVVWAFNQYNQVLGSSDLDTSITPANSRLITVHQHVNEVGQGQFIDIIAGDDEICITYVAASMPKGDQWSWTGDIGAACGQAWEHGASQHGTTASGDPYYPKCTWMDTDHGDDIEVDPQPITNRQMKIDIMAYGGKSDVKPQDYYCHSTIFTWEHADPIGERPTQGQCCADCIECLHQQSQDQNKRSVAFNVTQARIPRPRNQWSSERLIVNSRPQQSAITLCNSPTSRGSDFVSIDEGLYCDMETKILYPICDGNITDSCFDLSAEHPHLRAAGQAVRRNPGESRYKKINHWD